MILKELKWDKCTC